MPAPIVIAYWALNRICSAWAGICKSGDQRSAQIQSWTKMVARLVFSINENGLTETLPPSTTSYNENDERCSAGNFLHLGDCTCLLSINVGTVLLRKFYDGIAQFWDHV